MALASGLVVANSYYAQPLVAAIAESLHASDTAVGLVVTAGQVGYALGLAFLVPLGDMIERRRLLNVMLTVTAAGLLVMATAPTWQVLAAAAVVVSTGSVVGQILVPFAATLAHDTERGRVIGNVMTGLLLGILLSRVVAGLLAEVFGWRGVFV
ncbi:MAG: MFS transporter, partial [Rhodococcus sp.]